MPSFFALSNPLSLCPRLEERFSKKPRAFPMEKTSLSLVSMPARSTRAALPLSCSYMHVGPARRFGFSFVSTDSRSEGLPPPPPPPTFFHVRFAQTGAFSFSITPPPNALSPPFSFDVTDPFFFWDCLHLQDVIPQLFFSPVLSRAEEPGRVPHIFHYLRLNEDTAFSVSIAC